MVVTGDNVSTVMWEVPVLIGNGGYFDLEKERESAQREITYVCLLEGEDIELKGR